MKKVYRLDPENPPPLSPAARHQLAQLAEMADEDIDTADIPEAEDRRIKRESAHRLARLGGSAPGMKAGRRRRA